jgi:hypothetical protein
LNIFTLYIRNITPEQLANLQAAARRNARLRYLKTMSGESLELLEKYHVTLKVKEPVAQRAIERGGYHAELMGRCEIAS